MLSTQHSLILNVLKEKGFSAEFSDIIEEIYTGATTKIRTAHGITEDIDIRRGTKQGCPVSPILFNLCLEPLLEALNKVHSDDGYKIGNDKVKVQAYADDIILIAEDAKSMNSMLETCSRFCKYTKMELEPTKCIIYGYMFDQHRRCRYQLDEGEIVLNSIPLKVAEIGTSIRYLGVAIGARKSARQSISRMIKEEFIMKLNKIMSSCLSITQKIHAIKTFLIPTLDFHMLNGQLKMKDIDSIDKCIRGKIDDIVGARLPIEVFHASWRDGGLSIPSIRDKYDVLLIKSSLHMMLSRDTRSRDLAETVLNDEIKYRNLTLNKNGDYFEIDSANLGKGTNSIFLKAAKSTKNCDLIIKKEEQYNSNVITIISKSTDQEKTFATSKGISYFLTNKRRINWKDKLNQNTFHRHAFNHLINNPLSNDFVTNIEHPFTDYLFKFALKARTNTLPTGEFIAHMNNKEPELCPICINNNITEVQSLKHKLNHCITNYQKIKLRHNIICTELLKEITARNQYLRIMEDAVIEINELSEQVRHLRPDIQLWKTETEVILMEISCPYPGICYGVERVEQSFVHKSSKYNRLIEELEAQGINVRKEVIIVSSLGGWNCNSIKALSKYISKKEVKALVRRITRLILRLSSEIWQHNANSSEIAVDDTLSTEI